MSLKRAGRFFAAGIAVLVVSVLGLDLALEFLVAPEMVAAVCSRQLHKRLGRQVRIRAAGVGLWNGLWMEGVYVSEAPDFAAGDFLQARRISIRPRFSPMLLGRISAGEAVIADINLHVIRRRDGSFNFSDFMTAVSSTSADMAVESQVPAGMKGVVSRFREKVFKVVSKASLGMDIHQARVRHGEIVYTDPAANLNLLASDIDLWIDGAAVRGGMESRMHFKVQGLHAGKPLEAEVSWHARSQRKDSRWTASSGNLTLTGVRHPYFKTDLLRADWDLSLPPGAMPATSDAEPVGGFTPFLASAQGVLRLEGASGRLEHPAALAKESRWVSLLLYPLDVLARFRGLGFSDLGNIAYSELRGDYSFQAGSVNIAPFYVRGPDISLNAEGVIQLRRRSVGLKANVGLGKTAVGVTIQGPLNDPTITPSISFQRKRGGVETIEQKVRVDETR